MRKLAATLFLALSTAACSLKMDVQPQIRVVIPPRSASAALPSAGTTPPRSLDDFGCIGVNVTGPLITAIPGTGGCPGDNPPPLGVTGGFVDATTGGEITVQVPSGPNRLVQVIGIAKPATGCPEVPALLALSGGPGGAYELGRTSLNLYAPTSVSITMDFDSATPIPGFCITSAGQAFWDVAIWDQAVWGP